MVKSYDRKTKFICVFCVLGKRDTEIFARVLFSQKFAFVKFHENKILANDEITLSFIDLGKSCPSREFLTSQICLSKLFRTENSCENF